MTQGPKLLLLHPFDEAFTDKGYWPFAAVEFANGDCACVYFSQTGAFLLDQRADGCFARPGLIIVEDVTITAMERAVAALHAHGDWFYHLPRVTRSQLEACPLSDWPPKPDRALTMESAYDAMFAFLGAHYDRTHSEDIGGLLGDMSRLADGATADPAAWHDWQAALSRVDHGCIRTAIELQGSK